MSRIRERYMAHGDNDRAVAEGLSSSARTISSAALIMTSVFAVFVLTGVPSIKELGLGCAVAIALDATLVRLILVPAAMKLLGDWNWWMPSWLDRALPHLNFEDGSRRAGARRGLSPARISLRRSSRRVGRRVVPEMQSARSSRPPGASPRPTAGHHPPAAPLRFRQHDGARDAGAGRLAGAGDAGLIAIFTAVVLIGDLAPETPGEDTPGSSARPSTASCTRSTRGRSPATAVAGRSCRDAAGHPRRPLRRQRPDRRHRHRPRLADRRAAQGPLGGARGGPHPDPRLVGHGLHGPGGARHRQREPQAPSAWSSPTATRSRWTT